MKKLIVMGSFFLAASLLAAPVENAMTDKTTTVEASKDRFTTTEDHKIGSQVRVAIAEIVGAPKGNEVILIIDAGDVKLMGKVPSEDAKAKIVQAIHQIKGVKSVHNKLEVEKKKK